MPWLTLHDAARRVGRDPRTIKRWISDGWLEKYEGHTHEGKRVTIVQETPLLEIDRIMRTRVGGRPPTADPEYII